PDGPPPAKKMKWTEIMPFTAPDPYAVNYKPTDDDIYPYGKPNNTDDLTVHPTGYTGAWTKATFDRCYIPHKEIIHNVSPHQKVLIADKLVQGLYSFQ
ncbi:hypothetical protein V5O48_012451, partial [Marasmius crinis-equi]